MKWLLFTLALLPLSLYIKAQDTLPALSPQTQNTLTSTYSLSLSVGRNGSGTSWQPDASPVYALGGNVGRWNVILQGSLYLRYTSQNINNPGKMGHASGFDSPNRLGFTAQRGIGRNGLVTLNGTLFNARNRGAYPLFLSTDRVGQGQELVNNPLPQNVAMGLSVGYTQRLSQSVDVYGAVGYPAEPALGPSNFMQRISAFNNPDAPITAEENVTSYGAGTFGVRYKIAKVEGSVYSTSKPGEPRNVDEKSTLNSYSYRLSVNPSKNFALQFSQGFIKSPEVLQPELNIVRTTASLQHVALLSPSSYIASSVVYGVNSQNKQNQYSVLVESDYNIKRFAIYGRYERVKKSMPDLMLFGVTKVRFSLNSITFGANFKAFALGNLDVRIGGHGSIGFVPRGFNIFYGKYPLGGQVYIRMVPAIMKMYSTDKVEKKAKFKRMKMHI